MRPFEQDQPPFFCSSESEWFTGVLLQLHKTLELMRVIDLHFVSILEVKRTDVFFIISLICQDKNLKCCVKQSSVSFRLASPTITEVSGILLEK